MRGVTEIVMRHRRLVLLSWQVLFVLGVLAASNLGSLLSNRFSVPGSDSERGLNILRQRFHERGDGAFTLVVQSTGAPLDRGTIEGAARRGAAVLANGKAGPVLAAGPSVDSVQIQTSFEDIKASGLTLD